MKIRQLRLCLCLVSALLGCLWIGVERLVAPDLSAQDGLLSCLGVGGLLWIMTSPVFFQKYVGEATAESLGAIRIITCTILLIMTLGIEDVPSSALLPAEMRHPMGIMEYFYALPSFESFVRSQASLQIFEWLTALILFLGILGWQTRIVIPLGAVCYLLLGGILRHYTWFFHTGLIPTYVMVVLSLTPCSDGLSVDRQLKIKQGRAVAVANQPSPVYGWSRYMCWVVVALPYVAAGMSKLRKGGFFWWCANNMRATLYSSTLDPMQFDWGLSVKLSNTPDILFDWLGIMGVFGELAFGLVLFSRTGRLIMPILMGMMHIGIFFLQNILFFDLIVLQAIFFDFTKIRNKISQWIKLEQNYISEYERESLRTGELIAVASVSDHNLNISPNYNFREGFKQIKFSHSTVISSIQEGCQNFFYPLLISVFVVTLGLCWSHRTEFYPLTSMQMFSGWNNTGTTGYIKIFSHTKSGAMVRAYPEKIIPALFDTRYRLVTKGCFSKDLERVQLCEKFLVTAGSIHNKKANSGDEITKFEIQLWRWDFRANPSDPDYGDLMNRHLVRVNEL